MGRGGGEMVMAAGETEAWERRWEVETGWWRSEVVVDVAFAVLSRAVGREEEAWARKRFMVAVVGLGWCVKACGCLAKGKYVSRDVKRQAHVRAKW